MFEEIIREIKKLEGPQPFEMQVDLDEKRFYDRECPNKECQQQFKVAFDDWKEKVRDEQVFCPFCRHQADSTEWHTPEQIEHIKSAARAEMSRRVQVALRRAVARTPKQTFAGPFNISMSLAFNPGHIPPVLVAKAADAMRQDFTCEVCSCRFASVGASFFCPACGHNSANTNFDTTLLTIERTVQTLEPMRQTLTTAIDQDTAHDAIRQLLEDQFTRLVGAFERINEALFARLPNASSFQKKGAVFQRIDDASDLWNQAGSITYARFLSPPDISSLKILFQRRHVLTHRQGIIDQAYIDRSGDSRYSVGQRLVVRDDDVLELVRLMRTLVAGLRSVVP
jgi:uncharacterized Zn finger protein (UPF0148 family)